MQLPNVITARGFNKATLEEIFAIADRMQKGRFNPDILMGRTMATLFHEKSPCTRLSFEMAMKRLGGSVAGADIDGASLEDTIRVISGYGPNVIVLRYHEENGAVKAQEASSVPIISAGGGSNESPTQALISLFTIKQAFEKLEGLNIALVGDLGDWGTARSFCYFLANNYPNNRLHLVSPKQTRMRDEVKAHLKENDTEYVEYTEPDELDYVLPVADVIYVTGVETEPHKDNPPLFVEAEEAKKRLTITPAALSRMKRTAIIMHPLPRMTDNEINSSVDSDPRVVSFQQARNGLYVIMALLQMTMIGYDTPTPAKATPALAGLACAN
ncbi:MAG: aspartate carbamoyltransferase [Patescibacteria group bacterium]|nr:aspartate carbamoyltransferase [Patescibacteria group bacterium]